MVEPQTTSPLATSGWGSTPVREGDGKCNKGFRKHFRPFRSSPLVSSRFSGTFSPNTHPPNALREGGTTLSHSRSHAPHSPTHAHMSCRKICLSISDSVGLCGTMSDHGKPGGTMSDHTRTLRCFAPSVQGIVY